VNTIKIVKKELEQSIPAYSLISLKRLNGNNYQEHHFIASNCLYRASLSPNMAFGSELNKHYIMVQVVPGIPEL